MPRYDWPVCIQGWELAKGQILLRKVKYRGIQFPLAGGTGLHAQDNSLNSKITVCITVKIS